MVSKNESIDTIGRNARSYCEGHGAGVPEGMAEILAGLTAGTPLGQLLAECRRTHPRVDEELRRRGVLVHPDGRLGRSGVPVSGPLVDDGERPTPLLVHPAPADIDTGQLVMGERPLSYDELRELRERAALVEIGQVTDALEPAANVPTPEERQASIATITIGDQPRPRPTELRGNRAAGAVFSGGGAYRYLIWRTWGDERSQGLLAFVKHNPSKAGADRSDPTFDRAVGFAKRLGFAGVVMANLAALVATDPGELRGLDCRQLAGPANGRALKLVLRHARMIVVGWGNPSTPNVQALGRRFAQLARERDRELYCLGVNGGGKHPRHLLARGLSRIPDDAKLERWIP